MIKIPKKWRELPKEERLNIPHKIFGIPKERIEEIRKISDSKKRIIESARIQYEKYNDMHSYLTSWIAGFGSDVIIRQKFGSTKNLFDLFYKKQTIPQDIKPSWQDFKRRINIPNEMNEDLAEETGIHLGDGNMYVYKNSTGRSYCYTITGDLTNESDYHYEHIAKLIKRVYNIYPKIVERENKNSIETMSKSKSIVEFKNKILGLVIGPKKRIKIPRQISKNEEFKKRCVIGIVDTDFSITDHMAITGKLNSLFVARKMHEILEEQRIDHVYREYSDYGRFYIQKKGASEIIENWRLHNKKHISKYLLFKETGKFIPFSTTPERLDILKGKLDIEELEATCKKRAISNL